MASVLYMRRLIYGESESREKKSNLIQPQRVKSRAPRWNWAVNERMKEKNHSIIFFHHRHFFFFSGNIWQIKIFRLFLFYKYRKVNCSKSQKKFFSSHFRRVSELLFFAASCCCCVCEFFKRLKSLHQTTRTHFTISNLWPIFPGFTVKMGWTVRKSSRISLVGDISCEICL